MRFLEQILMIALSHITDFDINSSYATAMADKTCSLLRNKDVRGYPPTKDIQDKKSLNYRWR